MNHPGEIVPLSQLARPDVAIVLNVLPAHIGYFSSLDAIRKEKLSIARGLSPEGVLITPVELDVSDWEIQPGQVHHTFGLEKGDAFVTAVDIAGADDTGAENGEIWHVHASILGETVAFELRSGGNHRVLTALASLLAIRAAGGDLQQAGKTLGDIKPPDGRGNEIVIKGITIIDDSYNANPESMRLALEALSRRQIKKGSRKFAMLGEMLELGEDAIRYHQQLADACDGIDRIDAVGEPMKSLMASLKPASKGQWFADAGSMDINEIAGRLQAGDTLLVKGSNKVFWKNQFVQKLIDQLS
ncbi:MAG: UDP-N-acetylmuramoyl-tripeptide--D-alanyl-D-alanine ligase, partial [Gammaproteobacteria bacterium]|nr:UDP-N-acetylmuramoyl-tripeptide--D-alanyl-D-alanine ligase [Gammaproteobacteria bacterium]